jgi:hypothetical protein
MKPLKRKLRVIINTKIESYQLLKDGRRGWGSQREGTLNFSVASENVKAFEGFNFSLASCCESK